MRTHIAKRLEQAIAELQQQGFVKPVAVPIILKKSSVHFNSDYTTPLLFTLNKFSDLNSIQMFEWIQKSFQRDLFVKQIILENSGWIHFYLNTEALAGEIKRFIINKDNLLSESKASSLSLNQQKILQDAHARIFLTIKQIKEYGFELNESLGLENIRHLTHPLEIKLIHSLTDSFENLVSYLTMLVKHLQSYYNAMQLTWSDEKILNAQLTLLLAIQKVINNGLTILGIGAPESIE